VGKTTLATKLADEERDHALYIDLELPSDRAKLADPELYFASHEGKLVILDEIHRTPGIFQALRGVIDRQRRKGIKVGEFLVLGSASMDLLRQSAESLAGRIAYLELTPFTAPEVVKNGTSVATGSGYGADSQTASWPAATQPPLSGGERSFRPTSSETFRFWGLASPPKRCIAFGRCWRMGKGNSFTRRHSPPVSASAATP
jgi:hypothetical protein